MLTVAAAADREEQRQAVRPAAGRRPIGAPVPSCAAWELEEEHADLPVRRSIAVRGGGWAQGGWWVEGWAQTSGKHFLFQHSQAAAGSGS